MLRPGSVLGSFHILAPLGVGGMGEVWRARDSKLQREVAIKVLPDDFASDPERLSRFHREAQTLAALNHPNIAAVYDLLQDGSTRCLVLELVEGETLAERVRRGAIPLEEALPIAKQIADALEAAHEKGIVHRDLKPTNIKITPEGKVKVLDFGLAKMAEAAENAANLSHSPTLVSRTGGGVILGTPSYLSPEQARGKAVDKRTDIWAFGCVLYEMLSGKQAFTGDTVSDIVASILTRDLDWLVLPNVPEKLHELLTRCLQKDPFRRLRDIGDARLFLEDTPITAVRRPEAARRRTIVWISAIVAALAAGLGFTWMFRGDARDARSTYSGMQFGGTEYSAYPRVSPDGRLVAFQAMVDGQTQVAVMQPESGDSIVLTRDRTRGAISSYSWTSDGTRIYYGRIDGVPRGIFSVPAVGGEERLVLEDAVCPQVLPDGTILLAKINEQRRYQLYRFWPETRRLQPYSALVSREVEYNRIVHAFRDGKEAVFWGRSAEQPDNDPKDYWYSLDINAGTVKRIPTSIQADTQFTNEHPITASADDKAIVTVDRSGDLVRIIELPRNGGPTKELLSLTNAVAGLDVAPNGDVYVDQWSRPLEVLLMDADGSGPRTVFTFGSKLAGNGGSLSTMLPDGRILFPVRIGGRNRLLVTKPGQNPTPFVQTNDETSGPVTMVGKSEVAFLLGPMRTLAIASLNDGRIARWLENAHGAAIESLAALPNGKTMYYGAAGKIWSIPSTGGKPEIVRDGESVAVDPHGDSLIIQLNENNNVRFVRFPLGGRREEPLSFSDVRPATTSIAANAVAPNGVIVKNANYSDSWPWNLALLHPGTGKSQRIILPSLDVQSAGWTATGQIVVFAARTNSTIWRLRPALR